MNQHVHYFNSTGAYFASLNFAVHFIMYGYYALKSMRFKVSWDIFVTVLQVVQMIIGMAWVFQTATCEKVDLFGVSFGLIMYSSFFVLFVKFFVARYLFRSSSSSSSSSTLRKTNATTSTKANNANHSNKQKQKTN